MTGTQNKNISIFAPSNEDKKSPELEEAISLLKELGIKYNEKERKFDPASETKGKKFSISMDCSIGHEIGRVIAKIAFNYFIYCAQKSGHEDILFNSNFDKIKKYITGQSNPPIKEIISSIQRNPIIYDEKDKGRFIGHTLTFRQEKSEIIAQVSFLGKGIYTVQLGKIPEDLKKENFGSGHFFDPIGHKILPLSQNQSKWGTEEKIKYTIFNRM